MTSEKFEELKTSLEILDKDSSHGPWTYNLLSLIQKNPKSDIIDLAELTGNGKNLTSNAEKLNELGLIFIHNVGYSLSPLGKQFLTKLK